MHKIQNFVKLSLFPSVEKNTNIDKPDMMFEDTL